MAYSREIFQKIKEKIRFQQSEKEAASHYTILGNTLVRISNHCTWMKVWDDMLKKNPKWKGKPIVSVVFEDNGNTFYEDCLFSLGYRKRPIKVQEYVYESSQLDKRDINLIIQSIKGISKLNNYIDKTKKCKPYNRISICPDFNNIEIGKDGLPIMGGRHGADYVPESKNNKYNTIITMNNTKKRIRLTETQLHQIIKEAINELHKSAYMGRTTPYHYHNKTAAQRLADKAREQENYNEYDTPDDSRNEIDDEEWAYDHPQCRPVDKLKHQTVIPTFDGDSAHGRNPFSESIRRAIRQALR